MERFFSIMAFAGVLVIFSSSFLGAALDDELVFHLPFDEGAGKVAKDNSKNGHDAQLIANNKWVDGKIGKGHFWVRVGGPAGRARPGRPATLKMGPQIMKSL